MEIDSLTGARLHLAQELNNFPQISAGLHHFEAVPCGPAFRANVFGRFVCLRRCVPQVFWQSVWPFRLFRLLPAGGAAASAI